MHLELSAALGELEGNSAAGEAAVDLAVGIEAVVDTTTLLLVEDDLEGLGTVLLGAGALTDNLDGVDEVGEDGVVDGGQSARAGALLVLGGARVGGALGAGQDAALGHEENVAVGELLLELAGKTSLVVSSRVVLIEVVFFCWPVRVGRTGGCLPLLDLVEVGQEGDGDEDNDGLLAVADLNLYSENNVRALSGSKCRAHRNRIPPGTASCSANFHIRLYSASFADDSSPCW